MTVAREYNFDGLVGPTHNYAGLSFGNLASTAHVHQVSNPRQAALQGLQKMKLVHDLGIGQAVLPPLRRPRLFFLRELGFEGSSQQILEAAWKSDPSLVAACYSASNMWTANAATVSPSADCRDGRVHLTPANLISGLHRSIEAVETTAVLRAIFPDSDRFVVHDSLPASTALADEGAANHTRLCHEFGQPGVELFIFGRSALDKSRSQPKTFPARQTLEASQAVARRHGLAPHRCVFGQQLPDAIDAGVFHNDVIAVGNQNYLLMHEDSFVPTDGVLESCRSAFQKLGPGPLQWTRLTRQQLSLADAVKSYLFNSQLLTRPGGGMTLLCPADVEQLESSRRCCQLIVAEDNPVDDVQFLDLRQSMNNGGGPACLRLRVVLSDDEWNAVHPGVRFDDALYAKLTDWVNAHYREELSPEDLCDPRLMDEVDAALHRLCDILKLPESVFGLGL